MEIKGEWAIERTKSLSPRQLNRYRRGRNQLIAEVSERLGVGSLIIEI
jgi:hypothetical protein